MIMDNLTLGVYTMLSVAARNEVLNRVDALQLTSKTFNADIDEINNLLIGMKALQDAIKDTF